MRHDGGPRGTKAARQGSFASTLGPNVSPPRTSPNRLRRLVFSLIPAILLLAIGELGVRFTGAATPLAGGGPLGWTARPNLDEYSLHAGSEHIPFTVSTNADGLRTDIPRERTAGRPRAMTFGESTIFGWGVEADETPAGRLKTMLGSDWEVVNAGQPGFSSEQARRLAEMAIPAYKPDVVIWFFPWNDVQGGSRNDREALPTSLAELAMRPIWHRSHLLLALSRLSREPLGESANEVHAFGGLDDKSNGQLTIRAPPELRKDNLSRVKAAAERVGATVVTASLPKGNQRRRPGEQHRTATLANIEIAEELGLEFVDLTDASTMLTDEQAVLRGDKGHFTATANGIFMATLAPVVLRSQRAEGSPP